MLKCDDVNVKPFNGLGQVGGDLGKALGLKEGETLSSLFCLTAAVAVRSCAACFKGEVDFFSINHGLCIFFL